MTNLHIVAKPSDTTLTITVDEALRQQLAELAEDRGWTLEQAARVVLASHFLAELQPEPVRMIRSKGARR